MSGFDLQWVLRAAAFAPAAAVTCVYAWRRGGQPERVTAAMTATAIVATLVVPRADFSRVVDQLLLIDGALLLGLTAVALAADRFWPLYFAALQLLTVALHGVRAYDPAILPAVYARLGGELAYPTLVILAIGTWRHVRRGAEADWSWQVARDPIANGGGRSP